MKYKVFLRGEPNDELKFDTAFAVASLIQEHLLALQDYGNSDYRRIEAIKTYDFRTKTQLQSLVDALHSGASIHLTIRTKHSKKPLDYDTKPFFITSAFDVSGLVPTIRNYLSNYGISSATLTATNQTSAKCISRGLIPVTLYLGAYHNVRDMQAIDKIAPTVARQTAIGIYKFLTSGLFVQKQPRTPSVYQENECMASLFSDCYTTAWSGSDPDRGIYNSPIVATVAGGKVEYITR